MASYSGRCLICKREIKATLELPDGVLPPPVIGCNCQCRLPPPGVVMTYRGETA